MPNLAASPLLPVISSPPPLHVHLIHFLPPWAESAAAVGTAAAAAAAAVDTAAAAAAVDTAAAAAVAADAADAAAAVDTATAAAEAAAAAATVQGVPPFACVPRCAAHTRCDDPTGCPRIFLSRT